MRIDAAGPTPVTPRSRRGRRGCPILLDAGLMLGPTGCLLVLAALVSLLTGCAANSPRLEKAPPVDGAALPEHLLGLWQGYVHAPMGKPIEGLRISLAVTDVVPDGDGRWRLVTEGSRVQHIEVRRVDARIVVDFEVPDARTASPNRIRLTLNRQATALEGQYMNAYNPTAHSSWVVLYIRLDRYVAHGWTPVPSEVLPAAEARELDTTSAEALVPRLVGIWAGDITSPRGSSRLFVTIRAVRPDGNQWRVDVANRNLAGTVVEVDHGLVRLHAERRVRAGLVTPLWLWVRRGGNQLVGVVWLPWLDELRLVRLYRAGASGSGEGAGEGEPGAWPLVLPPEPPGR